MTEVKWAEAGLKPSLMLSDWDGDLNNAFKRDNGNSLRAARDYCATYTLLSSKSPDCLVIIAQPFICSIKSSKGQNTPNICRVIILAINRLHPFYILTRVQNSLSRTREKFYLLANKIIDSVMFCLSLFFPTRTTREDRQGNSSFRRT